MKNSAVRDPFKNLQYYRFCAYGFLKNLRFFDAFLILIFREAGLSYLQIGSLYSIREVFKNIFEIPSGIVADTFGRKKAMLFSFGAYIFSFALFYLGRSYVVFALSMIVFGLAEAFRSGTHKAMILKYLELNNWTSLKTQFYGRTRSWSQLGSALSSLLAVGIIFLTHQYRALFLISAIPYVLDFINLASYPDELDAAQLQRKEGFWLRLKRNLKDYFTQFASVPHVRAFFSAASFGGFFKTLKDYLQPVLQTLVLQMPVFFALSEKQRTAILIGASYFVLYLLTSYSARNAFKLEARFKNLALAIDAAYLVGVLSVIFSGLSLMLKMGLLAALLYAGLYLIRNIRRPLIVSYLSELLPSNIMASGLSTASQLETLVVVVASPILGACVDFFGLGAGIAMLGSLFLLLFVFVRVSNSSIIKNI
ncbi:major facilitator superfamily MFS_1 [Caldithrix abyssi DSM 13497]|uniref:Major Facilitator Superfamily protein n=1 Tax=Caldithrix abyssi DSM 13497 TaxID=880073 RepID=H1XTQ8_CALAY|nr:MFS transporter [Caldithrix abyssi]APF17432.1 Major Facilitator Superfamily protein [Caldithrix abyssi DSM 13497]EHO41533.1 major facilitator superfamily MFS_1 [Caldithrix abyssi DSM 13497]